MIPTKPSGYFRHPRTIRHRKQRFGKDGVYQLRRVIMRFYYYLHEDEVGRRDQGWMMYARDKE